MKRKTPLIYKILIFVGFIALLAMLLMLPMVSNKVGEWTGIAGDKIRGAAQTVAGIAIGVALVTWGIAALALPVLGGVMIVAGLAMIAYNVWPLFTGGGSMTAG
jgi:hypothetical protein